MKRALVAGAAGFLGSSLCHRLLADGARVVGLDNFLTGHIANLGDALRHPRFRFVEHDITRPLRLNDDFDEVYNLACPASPAHYSKDPHATVMISVVGVSNLLRFAAERSARLLQASTSEVYGDPLVHPQREDDNGNVNCTGPRACYDEGKRCAETLLFDAARRGADVKVARIFNTYGPRMQANDGRAVANFIVQALRDKPLTVYGDGSQTRSFCYVDDLIDGLVKLMASPVGFTGPVNLGNPDEITVRELAERVIRLTGSRARIAFKPLPVDDPRRRRPDTSRARDHLGWRATTPLDDGLAATIAYFRGVIRGPLRRADKIGRSAPAAETSQLSPCATPTAVQ